MKQPRDYNTELILGTVHFLRPQLELARIAPHARSLQLVRGACRSTC